MSKRLIFIHLKIIIKCRSTLVLFVLIWSTLVIFSQLRFYLVILGPFYPPWSYSVYFSPIRSTLVHFDLIWSTLVLFSPTSSTLVLFCSLESYSLHSIHFVLIRSTLVLFCTLLTYSVHFVHFGLIQSYLIYFGPFRSTLIQFCPHRSYSLHFVHLVVFSLIQSTSVLFGLLWFYSVHLDLLSPL